MSHRNWRWVALGGALVGIAVAAIACSTGGASDADLTAAQNQLKDKEAQLAAAQTQLGATQSELTAAKGQATSAQSDLTAAKTQLTAAQAQVAERDKQLKAVQDQLANTAPVTIIQAGQPVAAPAGAQPSGWTTAEAIRGGLKLVSTFDSSGPDAWSPAEHPLIYVTSEGTENESPLYDKAAPYFAGFHIIDAYSKKVVGSALFTINTIADAPKAEDPAHDIGIGREVTSFPHGVGVSPDGKWAYVGWGQKTLDGKSTEGVVAIVNMRTLKIDKLLKQESYYQGVMRSQRLHHIQGWIDSDGKHRVILQWGFGANGGPHHILDPLDDNKVVKAITYDDVMPMGHPFTTPSPDGKFVYVSMGSPQIREGQGHRAAIAKVNLTDGSVTVIPEVGSHPIGITHTADGAFTYVVDGHGSFVYKIDNATNEVVGSTSAGVAGPYGIALNWDETIAYIVGKGEGSHNRGGVLGAINLKTFRQTGALPNANVHEMPIWLGGSASSVDHAILHPDPAVNELWVSNMNGWDTIVLDLKTNKVNAHIPTPNGGNTHSGAFVKYTASWAGSLQSDMGGPKSPEMWALVKANVAKLAQAK
jgi:DNA-binding beta-propeller fold protein YncE